VTITLAVIVGQMVFGSLSYLIAGNNLKDAMQSGFSMAQIGEFAFIIAALGQSLGVTSDFLYPVVVAVSIITTFFTPYMIRAAEPAYNYLDGILPRKMSTILDNRSSKHKKVSRKEVSVSQAWKTFLSGVIGQTAAYLTLCIAIISICLGSLLPLWRSLITHWPGNIVCGIITLAAIAPCIRPIVMRKNHSQQTIFIRQQGNLHTFLFWVVVFVKFWIGCNVIYYVLNYLSPLWWVWHVIASVLLMIAIIRNKRVKLFSIRIERTFRQNLESRDIQGNASNPAYGHKLKGKDLHITSLTLPLHSAWGGQSLAQLHIGQKDNVHVAAIIRGSQRINIPGGSNKIYPMDTIEVVGDDESIQAFRQRMEADLIRVDENVPRADRLSLISVTIGANSPLLGRTLIEADLRGRYHCMVVGIEEAGGPLQVTQAHRQFRQGDILWVVGEEADLSMLRMGV
jgi:CPA2 family monovalent cation:H+ antiporter-2